MLCWLGAKNCHCSQIATFHAIYPSRGLIIVDEEHDPFLPKQSDLKTMYNARDAAIFMSHLTNSKIILGSATPGYGIFATPSMRSIA
ncbi:MAG: hypothetical protein IPN46_00010 [Saprospiraceae bacterium]|nr:hypothetical protein [Saprospiraceae bacterium]